MFKFYFVTICFVFDRARLWWGLQLWQISGNVKNKRNGGNHKVDENDDNAFINMYIFYFVFICLFMYLFN